MRLLSMREHSRQELERKLAAHEETPGDLQRALDELQAKGFISQDRVAESVLNRRAARLGAGRLRQELQAKGLDAEVVAQAMAQLEGTELARAREAWRRRFDALPHDAASRARQSRFLAARGFSGDVIRRVLAGGFDDAD